MTWPWRRRRVNTRPPVRFISEASGDDLKPWHLRAGMIIVKTDYWHNTRTLDLTVGYRDLKDPPDYPPLAKTS